ncbi:MAG TPA: hypothetical protein VI750_02120 [Pyrinomonadaceae bacterium]|nr:hypothetical protein [Pyrinomonadaceae bacterium]
MQHCWRLTILILVLTVTISNAEPLGFAGTAYGDLANKSHTNENSNTFGVNDDLVMTSAWPSKVRFGFEFLREINKEVVKEFGRAWRIAGGGMADQEGVVLIFRGTDGVYWARSLNATNEFRQCTFTWDPAAVAIVHTHRSRGNPRPSWGDEQVAQRKGVLVFTITRYGMYVYDPVTRKTRIVLDNLDWLKPSKFTEGNYRRLISGFLAVRHRARGLR